MGENNRDLIIGEEWLEYYDQFPYFSHSGIRSGCYPWKMVHLHSEKSIVLVHGLTDSPFYLLELGKYFHHHLGYSVFIPLLQCHGLEEPHYMDGVSRKEWLKNVSFAVQIASQYGKVSIGGLSTGGTICLDLAEKSATPIQCIYLFSAALALAGGLAGRVKEFFLRSSAVTIYRHLIRRQPLVNRHPYRYDYIEYGGAQQLALLIKEVEKILTCYNNETPYPRPIFAAHCEDDSLVSFEAVLKLQKRCDVKKFHLYKIARASGIHHAGLVLKTPIRSSDGNDTVLEAGNPFFQQLLQEIEEMEKKVG